MALLSFHGCVAHSTAQGLHSEMARPDSRGAQGHTHDNHSAFPRPHSLCEPTQLDGKAVLHISILSTLKVAEGFLLRPSLR